jgi:type 1 glutamine amidotransferase
VGMKRRQILAALLLAPLVVACQRQQAGQQTASAGNGGSVRLFVFSKTAAFRHAPIPDGIAALRQLADQHHVTMDFTEDSSVFTPDRLKQYRAVIFVLTSGNVFNAAQEDAFMQYIQQGGGCVGIHSASDTEHGWSWYGDLVGSFFKEHPAVQQATIDVIDRSQPSTSMLPERWARSDEWYNFATNPSNSVRVLLKVDESTYHGGTMNGNHPIAWYPEYNNGRAWYTAMGHTSESYHEPLFVAHIWGGIVYAARLTHE